MAIEICLPIKILYLICPYKYVLMILSAVDLDLHNKTAGQACMTLACMCMEVYCRQYYQDTFSWAKYKIFMGKHKFQWPTTARFRSQHMFSLSKYVTLWQTYFHGQSATFSWAKHNVFMGKLNCVAMRAITACVPPR